MKTKITLLIVALLLLIAGFTGIKGQSAPVEINIDALKTEIVATVYSQIYATVQAEFAAKVTPVAPAQGSVVGPGVPKPTQALYAHMAKLVKQDKNYLLYKQHEDWDVTFTFKNVGLQDWTNEFYLRYYKGEVPMQGKTIMLPAVKRGETTNVYLRFEGKDKSGIFNSYWELLNNDGHVILDNIFVAIEVK